MPGKNCRLLGKQPLVDWTIAAAAASKRIDRVILSTDDPRLIARYQDDERVCVLIRPAHLSHDHAGSVDVAFHALQTERDAGRSWNRLVLLQPTSPFRAPGRIDDACDLLDQTDKGSVTSICRARTHPYYCFYMADDKRLMPAIDRSAYGEVRSQDLPPAYRLTGSIYAIAVDRLLSGARFVDEDTQGLLCDYPGEDLDIDTLEDFDWAERFVAMNDRGE